MNVSNFEWKITEIYSNVDEFCKSFTEFVIFKGIGKRHKREPTMSISKFCTILIF